MIDSPSRSLRDRIFASLSAYGCLSLILLLTVIPFLWTFITSVRGPNENVYYRAEEFWPNFLPREPTFQNYLNVWSQLPMARFFMNTLLVSLGTVVLVVLLSSLAAFPLAKMRFRGRDFIFLLILATLIVPEQLTMIPLYVMMVRNFQLTNTLLGLILPFAVNAFGIFLLRQSFEAIPTDLLEAARIDGANNLQIWWRVMLPLARPGIAALAIFTFIGAWDRFLWPLMMLTDPNLYTLPIGLTYLDSQFSANARNIAAGAIMATIPLVVFFLFAQRYFIRGLTGAVKG
jgi:putative chitobiose transport system permease protein